MATATKNNKKVDLKRKVSIRQFVDPEVFNMGLEQYGLSVFSGESGAGGHKEWLTYEELGDTQVYLTGLDEKANYLNKITDDEKREAVIAQIKEYRTVLEGKYGKETINSNNTSFWKRIFIEMRVPSRQLSLEDPSDLILFCAIKAGGFSEIAPSYETAKNANRVYKYYLHEEEEVMNIKVELTKLRNKARVAFEAIVDSDTEHTFLLAKTYLPMERGYNRRTPMDTLYDDVNNMIDGISLKTNLKQAPKQFLELVALDKVSLRYKAIVREANFQKVIIKDKDNRLVNTITSNVLGKNEEDVIEYLKNPLHQEDLIALNEKLDKIWK